ncbi:monalysin family beta-barrel pore-forming toxin [Pseudomonas tructae]|nr:monalysin family beta-barrel pore-forming toxin [Pseudomonas tructae]
MSVIDKNVVAEIRNFPYKKGNYEIENYLFGEQDEVVRPGCLMLGPTLRGDMAVAKRTWQTYSVPVMAYLSHLNTVRVPTKVKHTQEVAVTEGYSRSFTATLETEVSIGAGFIVACGLSIKASIGTSQGIFGTTARTQKLEIEGPGVFNVYQVNIVYAHCVTSAGELASRFRYAKVLDVKGRKDLFFLSSIATDTVVPVVSEHSVMPVGWEEAQVALLMQGYDPEMNGGRFGFDFRAGDLPGGRY